MKNDERDTPSLSPLENRWLTAEEAAAYIGVKVETLSKWRLRGHGPRYSAALRRDPRYRLSDLMDHMAAQMVSNTREARTVRISYAADHSPMTLRRPTRPLRSVQSTDHG